MQTTHFQNCAMKTEKLLNVSRLTEIEQILTIKILMHSLPHKTKISAVLFSSRKCALHALEKWDPLWGTFGSHLSVLPMHHGHYEKESPMSTQNVF